MPRRNEIAPVHYAVPGPLARRAGQVRPADQLLRLERAEILSGWLVRLCADLDRLLDDPISCESGDGFRDVTVLGGLCYRVHEKCRAVIAGGFGPDGFEAGNSVVELLHPLAKPAFLRPVIDSLSLPFDARRPDLFVDEEYRDAITNWLASAAYRLLRDDPRFRRLRRHDLSRALRLDPALVEISLKSRQRPWHQGLSSELYARVWRREEDYRRVAAVAPQLLPLFDLLVLRTRGPMANGPLGTLREQLSKAGVQPAAWRLLMRDGARLLGPVWQLAPQGYLWAAAIDFILHLQESGLPALPPLSVLSAWYSVFGLRASTTKLGYQAGVSLDPNVLRAAFGEADRRRRDADLDGFVDQFVRVAAWSNATKPTLDLHQRRAGWPLLRRRADDWWNSLEKQKASRKRWRVPVKELRRGTLRAAAITSPYELLHQGQQMRNCAGDYTADCGKGLLRMYAIYRDGRARPVAHAGLRRAAGSREWKVWQVKGRANSDPGRECARMATAIATAQKAASRPLRAPESPHPRGVKDPAGQTRKDDRELQSCPSLSAVSRTSPTIPIRSAQHQPQ